MEQLIEKMKRDGKLTAFIEFCWGSLTEGCSRVEFRVCMHDLSKESPYVLRSDEQRVFPDE